MWRRTYDLKRGLSHVHVRILHLVPLSAHAEGAVRVRCSKWGSSKATGSGTHFRGDQVILNSTAFWDGITIKGCSAETYACKGNLGVPAAS